MTYRNDVAPLLAGLSLWLLPRQSDAERWQPVVDLLATRHGTQGFQVHATAATIGLQTRHDDHLNRVAAVCLQTVASTLGPITLPASEPCIGETFFQCVFCEIPSEPIADIGQRFLSAARASGLAPAPSMIPTQPTTHAHISLLYGAMGVAKREAIAASISRPVDQVTFGSLALVSPGDGCADFSKPDAWQILTRVDLGANAPDL
ncbi:MAG: hypothetical protein AB8C46_20680 [Burkholderiaceae bacterium]